MRINLRLHSGVLGNQGTEMCALSLSIWDCDSYEPEDRPLTISITAIDRTKEEDQWETLVDLNKADALKLRAALTAMIEVMK